MKIKLNSEQETSLERISGTEDFFVLKGYAGTGKTTVITHWMEAIRTMPENFPKKEFWHRPKIVLTAPTNKATNVLRDKAKETKISADVCTIHSLLSLKLQWIKDEQVLIEDRRGEDKFGDYDWVVIDECGMLDKKMIQYIQDAQERAGNRVVYMGDPCQLPPISEINSDSFSVEATELTRIMRQADGNPIMALSMYLRELILSEHPHYPNQIFDFVDDEHILYHPVAKYEISILDAFADPKRNTDIRHVAWTNRVVDSWNDKIRDRIYGFDRGEWTKGERIVTTAPVMDTLEDNVLFTTDTLLTIMDEPKLIEVQEIPCWELMCRGRRIFVPLHTSKKLFADKKDELIREAKGDRKRWRFFYKYMEAFAHVKPAHSLTVHRSQGSTFDDVYVSFQNILQNPVRRESLQCLYVAITRPRTRLILV